MSFIGNTPTQQSFTAAVDVFSGNGSTTAFTLSRPVASVAQVEAVIENVQQSPIDAYTVSGNTITFTSAPPSGSSNIYVRYTSPITQVIQPSDGSVGLNTLSSAVMSAIGGMGFKNRIINGGMVIDQRNAGASVTPASGTTYLVDRFNLTASQSSKFTCQQNAGYVTPPNGFKNYLGFTSSSAFSSAAGDYFLTEQVIEGFNVADLGWGTANAQTVTLSFWVRSSLTGTQSGSIRNADFTRSYPFSFTVSAANTWEQKTITIAGDTSGTWLTNNSYGVRLDFDLGTGTTYRGTANAWAAGSYVGVTGAVSIVGTNGATFYITGVQLEKGSTATSFDYRPYGTELALCQRYYWQWSGAAGYQSGGFAGMTYSTAVGFNAVNFPVTMRSAPTLTPSANATWQLLNSSQGATPTGITISTGATTHGATLQVTGSGLNAGVGSMLWANTTSAKLEFSAEL